MAFQKSENAPRRFILIQEVLEKSEWALYQLNITQAPSVSPALRVGWGLPRPLHSSGYGKVDALSSILNNSDTNMFSRCFPLECSESPELRVSLLYLIAISLTLG